MFAFKKNKSKNRWGIAPKLTCVFLALVVSGVASAQDRFDTHVADMVILMAKGVQKAIGLSEAQRNAMNNYAKQFDSQMQSYRQQLVKSKGKPDGAKIAGLQVNLRSHVFAQLSATQLKRLREISLQHDGVVALADEVVANKVGLSPAQLKKIRDIIIADRTKMSTMEREAAKPILDRYKTLKPKNEAEGKALAAKFSKEMKAAAIKYAPRVQQMVTQDRNLITSVLDSKQKNTWNMLLGKPYSG